jgi:hypothetical protein
MGYQCKAIAAVALMVAVLSPSRQDVALAFLAARWENR